MRAYTPVLFCFAALLTGCAATTEQAGPAARSELLETHWRPVEIDGKPVTISPGEREAHLVLTREGRVSGNTGCNSLGGVFRHSADGLRFDKLLMTRRTCVAPEGNALESAFVEALESTASHRISGESLELRDAAGVTRMRLEASRLDTEALLYAPGRIVLW